MASNWRTPQPLVCYGCRQSDWCVTQGASHSPEQYSLGAIVLGDGINGASVVRDAPGRGASMLLLECGDLARGDTFSDLGEDFGHGFSAKAVHRLVDCAWAIETDDILCRLSKLGLNSSALQPDRLAQYLEKKVICS